MSKIDEILAEAGFPNTPEGRAAFYKKFPTKQDWKSYKKMKKGGSLSGAPHNGQPTADEFFSFGDPTFGNLNIPFGNFAYGGYFQPGGTNLTPPAGTANTASVKSPMNENDYNKMQQMQNILFESGSKKYKENWQHPQFNEAIDYITKTNKDMLPKPVKGQYAQDLGVDPAGMVYHAEFDKPQQISYQDYLKGFQNTQQPAVQPTTTPSTPAPVSKPQWGSTTLLRDGTQKRTYADGHTEIVGTPRQSKPLAVNAYGGGLPNGANEMPCMNCGGYMDDGGDVASPTNYGAFPNTEYGGMLNQDNNQDYPIFEHGGNEFEKGGSFYSLINNLKKQKKKLYKSGGDTVMQGGNSTDYPSKIRSEFDNAIKANTYNAFVDEQGDEILEQFKQMGGPQLNPQNQAYQQMLQQNINQGQSGLNQAANNLYGSTMDVFNTMGTKEKTKVKQVKAGVGIQTEEDTKPTEEERLKELEPLLNKFMEAYSKKNAPKQDYYPYGYAPQQYGYPAHQYNYGYGMGYFPMNYGYRHSISSSDVEALKQLAKNPSSNLKEFSHRKFGPWSKTKMTFGYKDQLPEITPSGNVSYIPEPSRGFTEGFPAVHTVEDMPERRAADLKSKLQALPIARENYKDMDFEQYANDILNPSYPQYTPPVQETYNPGFKDMSYEDQLEQVNNSYLPLQKGFDGYPINSETGPRADNQYQNMVEVNPLQRFIPKQIMMDRELGKKYGGLHKAVEGVGTPISFPNWGNTSFGQTPQFSTPESVGYSKPVQSQSVGQTFGNTLSDKTTSFRSDVGPEKQVEVTQKTKPKFNQKAMANWEIAGADMLRSGLEQISEVAPNKRKLKESTVADNAAVITPENAISQGDYEINLSTFRAPDHTPVQFHGQSVVAYGGFMQDGGVPQQDSREQQIMQGVAQMLQQGAESEQILEQLVQMGLPEEQASEIINTVINQLQMSEQQQPEQEQMQPAMRYGGYANGGIYEEGQELDLTPQEIAELEAQGYSIEKLA